MAGSVFIGEVEVKLDALIKAQDIALRNAAQAHQSETGHVVSVYNNFIQCQGCSFHVHVTGFALVEHTKTVVVNVTELVMGGGA